MTDSWESKVTFTSPQSPKDEKPSWESKVTFTSPSKQTGEVPSEPAESYPAPVPAAPSLPVPPFPPTSPAPRGRPVAGGGLFTMGPATSPQGTEWKDVPGFESAYNFLTDPLAPGRKRLQSRVDPALEALFGTHPSEQTWRTIIPDVSTVAAIPGEVIGAAERSAKRVADALGISPAAQRDIAGMIELEMGGVGPGLTEAARALKAGAGVAVPLARSVPQIEAASRAAAETAGTAGRMATAPVQWVWDKGAQNVRALKGAQSEQKTAQLVNDIRSGAYKTEARESLAGTTRSEIERLRQAQKITTEEAQDALAHLEKTVDPQILRFREQADAISQRIAPLQEAIDSSPLVGQTGKDITNRVLASESRLKGILKAQGDADYGDALGYANTRYEMGDYWMDSEPGKDLFKKWYDKTHDEKLTVANPEVKKFINDYLIPKLKGEKIVVEEAPGISLISAAHQAEIERVWPGSTAGMEPVVKYKPVTPERLRDTLRELRDGAKGYAVEGFANVRQNQMVELANDLAASLSDWEESFGIADARYRANKVVNRVLEKPRASKILARGKYNPDELISDPLNAPNLFFKSEQSVKDLTDLYLGDSAAVNRDAANYAFRNLSGKTPAEMQDWLKRNEEWLNPQVLPDAFREVKSAVNQIAQGDSEIKALTKQAEDWQESKVKKIGEIRKLESKKLEKLATQESSLKNDLAGLDTPLERFTENVRRGITTPEEAVSQMKTFLQNKDEAAKIPFDVRERWVSRLNEIESIRDKEAKRRMTLKVLGLAALGATGVPVAKSILHRFYGMFD